MSTVTEASVIQFGKDCEVLLDPWGPQQASATHQLVDGKTWSVEVVSPVLTDKLPEKFFIEDNKLVMKIKDRTADNKYSKSVKNGNVEYTGEPVDNYVVVTGTVPLPAGSAPNLINLSDANGKLVIEIPMILLMEG